LSTRHQLSRRPKYASLIGMLALETVDLEIELSLLFSALLSLHPSIGEVIYLTPRGDQSRIEMLRHAASIIFAIHPSANPHSASSTQKRKYLKRIRDIAERAHKSIQNRHRAVHDEWFILRGEKRIKRGRVDIVDDEGKSITLKQLKSEVREMRLVIDEITTLAKEFIEFPPKLPQRRLTKRPGKNR